MLRAALVKLAAAALVAVEAWLLPPGLCAVAIVVTIAAMCAFFAYVIVAPRAQFLVRSVFRLPAPLAEGTVAFTFDDGPDPVTTPRVLDLLAEHGARATFFVVGSRAQQHAGLVRRILAEGHALGSHTFTHSNAFHFRSPKRQREDVQRGIDTVTEITGASPRLFRPPQGLRTPLLRDALAPLSQLVCVTWTERGLDAMGRKADAIIARLEGAIRPGAILTLHDGAGLGGTLDRSETVKALGKLLDVARERGLRCVSLEGVAS